MVVKHLAIEILSDPARLPTVRSSSWRHSSWVHGSFTTKKMFRHHSGIISCAHTIRKGNKNIISHQILVGLSPIEQYTHSTLSYPNKPLKKSYISVVSSLFRLCHSSIHTISEDWPWTAGLFQSPSVTVIQSLIIISVHHWLINVNQCWSCLSYC